MTYGDEGGKTGIMEGCECQQFGSVVCSFLVDLDYGQLL
jgi:hypothetical protein